MTTPANISKLPKWAQDHIANIARQRDVAVRELSEYVDNQTPAKFFTESLVCLSDGSPEFVKRYIQADTITVEFMGVRLRVDAHDHNKMHGKGIRIKWEPVARKCGDVAMIPYSSCSVRLISMEKEKS